MQQPIPEPEADGNVRELGHLTRRFLSSLRPTAPDDADTEWLESLLSDAEQELYDAQPSVDRFHSVRSAVAVRDALGPDAPTEVVVASALHDVGKAEAHLGTPSRVLATVLEGLLGHRRVVTWCDADGFRGRLGAYVHHAERGAELLSEAGSGELSVAWARGHHLDRPDGVDDDLLDLLRAADRA